MAGGTITQTLTEEKTKTTTSKTPETNASSG